VPIQVGGVGVPIQVGGVGLVVGLVVGTVPLVGFPTQPSLVITQPPCMPPEGGVGGPPHPWFCLTVHCVMACSIFFSADSSSCRADAKAFLAISSSCFQLSGIAPPPHPPPPAGGCWGGYQLPPPPLLPQGAALPDLVVLGALA